MHQNNSLENNDFFMFTETESMYKYKYLSESILMHSITEHKLINGFNDDLYSLKKVIDNEIRGEYASLRLIKTYEFDLATKIFSTCFITPGVFLKAKQIHNIKEHSTKRFPSKPPQIISSFIRNNSPVEQELSTQELELTITVSKSTTTSTSTEISKEFTSSLSSEVSVGSIGLSLKETTSSSKSETLEKSVEKKVKIPSQQIKVPANSTIKVLTKCSTYTSKTLYLIDVELDNDLSYYNCHYRNVDGNYQYHNGKTLRDNIKWHNVIVGLDKRGEDEVNIILVPETDSKYVLTNIPMEVSQDSYHTSVEIESADMTS